MGLLDLFKKDMNIYAPVKGKCLDIIECEDAVFSAKMMGDGFIIIPEDDVITSPADGTLTMIFPTAHAFGIKMYNEQEVLVHIGINTVELEGKHFELLSQMNQKVKKGTPIVKFDVQKVKELGYDTSVIVACVNRENVVKQHLNEQVTVKDVIIGG